MCALKTRPTDVRVDDFLETIENKTRRSDGFKLLEIFKEVTGETPIMWGSSIVGFGVYSYENTRGKEFEWPRVGYSPRKRSLSIYINHGFDRFKELLDGLGKHRLGKGCLYINKLADVDINVLKEIIGKAYRETT